MTDSNLQPHVKSRLSVVSEECRPMNDVTGFQRILLLGLAGLYGSQPNGSDLKRSLGPLYEKPITRGRLYQNLGTLLDSGYVEKRPYDGRTYIYTISETGRRRLRADREWAEWCLRQCERP